MAAERLGFRQAAAWLAQIIGPDAAYVRLGLVYTVAISLLALATPISVQLLINSVANTALRRIDAACLSGVMSNRARPWPPRWRHVAFCRAAPPASCCRPAAVGAKGQSSLRRSRAPSARALAC